MSGVEVESGVPIPRGRVRYPYGQMMVGDSFVVVGGRLQVVCNANWRAGKRLMRRFIARREGEDIRVWRIE